MPAAPRTLLAYGDSNTWGYATVPRPDNRYAWEERWPGVAQAALGPGWRVIEEGLNSRTTVHPDPVEGPWLDGSAYLLPCLRTHRPVDVVVIALGANDLKARFSLTPHDIAYGLERLIGIVRTSGAGPGEGAPAVLVVLPPPILEEKAGFPEWRPIFAGGAAKSQALGRVAVPIVTALGAACLDAGEHIRVSDFDGLHLDPDSHAVLGCAIAREVLRLEAS